MADQSPPSTYGAKAPASTSGPSFLRGGDPSQDAFGLSDNELNLAGAFGLDTSVAAHEYQATHPGYSGGGSRYASGWWTSAPRNIGLPTGGKRRIIDAYKELSEMGPDQLTGLQRRLYDAGLMPDSYYAKRGKEVPWGQLDDATVSAFGETIQRSLRSGGRLTPDEVLNDAIGKGGGKQKEDTTKKKPPPFTIELTPADTLLETVDAVAAKTIGRRLTDQELRHFVDSYHSMQADAQQSKYQAEAGYGYDQDTGQLLGPGGTITAPVGAQEFAMSQLRREHPDDVQNMRDLDFYKVFHDLLAGNI